MRTTFFHSLALPLTVLACSAAACCDALGWSRLDKQLEKLWASLLLRVAWVSVERRGASLPPREQPVVFIANHVSQFDIPMLTSVFGARPLSFIAKESLFRIPLFGAAMRAGRHVPVRRENRRAAMRCIDDAVARAAEGYSPVVFPEGGFQASRDELNVFRTGGVILAIKTGLPIVPVVHRGTYDVMAGETPRLGRGRRVVVRTLPAIPPGEYTLKDRDRLTRDLEAAMGEAYAALKRELP